MTFSLLSILYYIVIIIVCFKIVLDTTNTTKALVYVFLVIAIPIIGIGLYFSVGVNYRKRKMYKKKLSSDIFEHKELEQEIKSFSGGVLKENKDKLGYFNQLATVISPKTDLLTTNNNTVLLKNGDTKFPEILKALKKAKHHIHLEYYIYENDTIGNEIANILIEKVKEGVKVRFIYDDLGSKSIRKNIVKLLKSSGIDIAPFYKIKLITLANRLNYRNHRKIIIIDGETGFVGGINVSNKYINVAPYNKKNKLFWRDTHLKIEGQAVLNLQHIFLTDWNFCANDNVAISNEYFPILNNNKIYGNQLIQISASGPDSAYPNIMYTLIQAILLSKREVLITTPYFIPEKSYTDALTIAALSGVSVKILIPGISDSFFVNSVSNSYYQDLLEAGIQIYKYKKGFVHSKTMICDDFVSFVGTANLDNRSFDLNFEANAIVYDKVLSSELKKDFLDDLLEAEEIKLQEWKDRSYITQIIERIARLFSPLM